MTLNSKDFEEYDMYKNMEDEKDTVKNIMKEKTMYKHIYYWDNSSNNIMIEVALDKYTPDKLNSDIEKLKQVNDIFKKGYIVKNEIVDNETFDLLMEHLIASAFRYSLIQRKPFILMDVKYEKLNKEEITCLFEYIIHSPLYLDAVRYKDPICYVKIEWWSLKDIIEKYKEVVRLGMNDYNYQCEGCE